MRCLRLKRALHRRLLDDPDYAKYKPGFCLQHALPSRQFNAAAHLGRRASGSAQLEALSAQTTRWRQSLARAIIDHLAYRKGTRSRRPDQTACLRVTPGKAPAAPPRTPDQGPGRRHRGPRQKAFVSAAGSKQPVPGGRLHQGVFRQSVPPARHGRRFRQIPAENPVQTAFRAPPLPGIGPSPGASCTRRTAGTPAPRSKCNQQTLPHLN